MENEGIEIKSVELSNDNIVVKYESGATETLPNDLDTYKAFHEKWLLNNPPFISDIYKAHMRNIILASINNNTKCISDLKVFFQSPNENDVKKFFSYMRTRPVILPPQKAIWKPVLPAS